MPWIDDFKGDYVNLTYMIRMYVSHPERSKNQFFVCVTDGGEEFSLKRFSSRAAAHIWMKTKLRQMGELKEPPKQDERLS